MAGKSNDPKRTRITVRLGDSDLKILTNEARRRGVTVGAIVRDTIRVHFGLQHHAPALARRSAKS